MHIVSLEAENFKRLKAVRIDPDTNTVVIAGRNAQGKSSVLDAIQAALAGKSGAKKSVKRAIRDGETKARVVITLDDLVVERKWTASGTTLTVSPRNSDAKLNSPQAVLDRLTGALSFDPLEFAESDPKAQVETLIDLIGREKFDALADERKAAYDNRTDINREVRRLQAEVSSRADAVEMEPVDVSALVELAEGVRRKTDLREEWEVQQLTIERAQARQAEIVALAAELPDGDYAEISARLKNAGEINAAAQRWIDRQAAEERLAKAQEVSAKHTALIESVDEQRAALIANANLPVDGLSFDDEGVQYQGIPFEQASAAERLKVSAAMAMALNPELKVICIRDASLLDDQSKLALVEMAKAHDYQIWYEVVATSVDESVGVLIEDGEVL
jgi:predicted AAA+ superfamily ATPase